MAVVRETPRASARTLAVAVSNELLPGADRGGHDGHADLPALGDEVARSDGLAGKKSQGLLT
jgi:hypothetical protein